MPLSNPIFRKISRIAGEQGVRAFVVGGYVRDHYLRRPSTDIDVVVVGSGIALAEALGRELHTKVSVFKTFGTAMLRAGGIEVEFVGARKESYTHDSRKPQVEAGTLEDDQRRRDFTINAMAWSLDADSFGELVDPFDGLYDLEECIIRTPCDPDITFSDDPLRMMRAVRFASQLGFTIEEETFDAIRRNAPRIGIVSRERIAAELNKIVLSPVPSIGFELLEATGLLERIFPELHNLKGVEKRGAHAHKDNFVHTLKVLDNVARHSDDLWLRWAAVLHDIAKPLTKAYDPKAGWTPLSPTPCCAGITAAFTRRSTTLPTMIRWPSPGSGWSSAKSARQCRMCSAIMWSTATITVPMTTGCRCTRTVCDASTLPQGIGCCMPTFRTIVMTRAVSRITDSRMIRCGSTSARIAPNS